MVAQLKEAQSTSELIQITSIGIMFFTEVLKSVFCWNVSFSNIFLRFIVVLISKDSVLVLTVLFINGGYMMSMTGLDRNLLLAESSVDLIEGAGLL